MGIRAMASTLALGCGLASMSANALVFNVDSTADVVDMTPGDGVCMTESAECTLRAAVMEANASGGADIIDLSAINDPASPITLTLSGVDETFADSEPGTAEPCVAVLTPDAAVGDLDITEDLEIVGAGPGLTVIQWDEQSIEDPNIGDRIFHVQAETGTTINLVRIADLMVTRGSVGILNDTDPANIYNCDVSGEQGSLEAWQFRRFGGGIAVGPGAAVVLFEETEHGPGTGGGGGEGPPPGVGPGGDEGEETGGVTAVEFERIAVIGNQSGSDAGGIIAAAEMTIVDSVLSGNTSGGNGGALYLDSTTNISGSLIGTSGSDVPYLSGPIPAAMVSNPNVGENGGGIFDTGSHTTNIETSALNGNTAIGGGAIGGRALVVINITNSTVSGNTGTDVGGGITTNGTINLRNVTVANNTSTTDAPGGGAGLNSFGSGTYTFVNTILSNNIIQGAEGAREANCGCSGGSATCPPGVMVSTGFNINDEIVDTCLLDIALNDQPGADPLLEALANNGGLTETHALPSVAIGDPATSPAIDAGQNARCATNDQRGSLRPDDGDLDGTYVCDIGAFELFIARTDLHINNLTVPNQVNKADSFTATVEIHNDDGNSTAPGVTFDATLDTLTGMSITAAVSTAGSCIVASSDELNCSIGDMAVGDIETVTITLIGNQQGSYALESVISTTDPGLVDPVPENNTVIANIAVLGNSDLAVTGGPDAATADQGDAITLNYNLVNNGEDDASEVRLGLVLPTSVSFVSATTTKGVCEDSAGEVLCRIGALSLAETTDVQVVVTADRAGDIDFEASAAADQNDPDDANNLVRSTVSVVANADIALTAASVSSIRVTNTFAVTLTAANNGPQDASNIIAVGTLPTQVSFVSGTGCTIAGSVVTCTAATLAAGASASFTINVKAEVQGSAVVSASVSANENDPVPANNQASATVDILKKNSSGGGCAYNPGGPVDPTLPALLLIALAGLWLRRRPVA